MATSNKHEQQLLAALRTELSHEQYSLAAGRLTRSPDTMRLLHAAMGICTEAGELMDAIKKYTFYNKSLDEVNVFEEGGDIEWYLLILADTLRMVARSESPFEEMVDRMLAKLRKRYPEKFTEENALVRDLESERRVLEKSSNPLLPDPPHRLPKLEECPIAHFVCINPECDGQEAYETPSGYVCLKCGAGQ